jgi:hypothetical protein
MKMYRKFFNFTFTDNIRADCVKLSSQPCGVAVSVDGQVTVVRILFISLI